MKKQFPSADNGANFSPDLFRDICIDNCVQIFLFLVHNLEV